MIEALLIVHLIIAAAMVAVVLLQKSEGGALGIGGGGGGGGGFLSGRGTDNMLTKITALLAGLFFLSSIALSVLPNFNRDSGQSRFNQPTAGGTQQPGQPGTTGQPASKGSLLDRLKQRQGGSTPSAPAVPQSQ